MGNSTNGVPACINRSIDFRRGMGQSPMNGYNGYYDNGGYSVYSDFYEILQDGISTAIPVDIPLFLPIAHDQIFELILQAFGAGLLSGFSMFFICWGANLALNILRSS